MQRLLGPIACLTLLLSASALACESSSGEIEQVDARKNTVIVSTECDCGSGKIIRFTFTLKDGTKVLLNGKDAKLVDLKQGDKVEVEYDTFDDVEKVSATRDG